MDVRNDAAISPKEGPKLVKKERLVQYLECSAKTGEGLNQVYDCAAKAAVGILKRKTSRCCIL